MSTGFCPLCDVSLDLHDGPDSCSTAQAKADLLDSVLALCDETPYTIAVNGEFVPVVLASALQGEVVARVDRGTP